MMSVNDGKNLVLVLNEDDADALLRVIEYAYSAAEGTTDLMDYTAPFSDPIMHVLAHAKWKREEAAKAAKNAAKKTRRAKP